MDNLIYDRLSSDVDTALNNPDSTSSLKGAYNYTDLNRIENNCKYVMNLLNNSGLFYYPIIVETKTDWTMKDIPHIKDINRIRKNIQLTKVESEHFEKPTEELPIVHSAVE